MPYIGNIVQDFSVNTAMLNTDSVTSIKIDDGTIVNADINDSAAIAMSKLALSITNSEVNSSAAIAGSKISPDFGSQNVVTTGTLGSGNLTVTSASPEINLVDSGDNPDYKIRNQDGTLRITDTTNNAGRFVVNSDGHIDVLGNLDVGAGLDVEGAATFNDSGASVDFRVEGDTNTHLLFVDASTDRVGINESSPSQKLVVGGDIGVGFTTPNDAARQINFNVNRGSAGDTLANINWQWNSKFVAQIRGIAGADTTNKDDAHLAFFTSAANNLTEALRIDSSRRFLLNLSTSVTGGKFQVNNTFNTFFAASNDTQGCVLQLQKTRATSPGTYTTVQDGDKLGELQFKGATGSAAVIGANIQAVVNGTVGSGNDLPTDLTFRLMPDGIGSTLERMRITSTGNVGIGTTSPTYKLHVTRTDAAGDYAYFGASSDGGQRGLVFTSSDSGIFLGAIHTINAGSGAGQLAFATASTERMRIDASGNVMLGVSSTTNRFHVEGTTTGSRFGVDVSSSGITALAVTNESNADVEMVIYDGRSSIGSSVNIPIAFHTNGKTNERMRLTTSGELLVGMSNSQAVAGGSAKIQVQSNDSTGRISIVQHRNEASGAPFLSLGKTRATSTNNSTLVQNGDNLGTIAFAGGDGTDIQSTAVQLVGVVSDNPGSNDMPGSLEIYTTPNGSDSPKQRINLTHKGEFQLSNQLGSGNIINQISRAEGNTTETFTLSQLGLDDNNYVMIWIVASGTGIRDYAHSLITWLQPLGNNSSINTQIDAMGSGSGVSTFTQAVNGNDLVITKDSDLALNLTVIGGGGRRTTIGWG